MHFVKKHSYWILILAGTVVWSLTMVKSGLRYEFGLGFWGANGHDGIWHLAMAKILAGGSFAMPVFAGETIKNYHLGFDLFLAGLHVITRIPVSVLYFQILPPLFAGLFGVSLYLFMRSWKPGKPAVMLALFFGYFGGSWGWLINLIRSGHLGGESMFWSQQAISTLINPPLALSLVCLSFGLLFLHRYLETRRRQYFFPAAVIFGILPLIKVYAGILSLIGLLAAAVFDLVRHRHPGLLKMFAVSAGLSALVFFPFNRGSAGLIVFQPLWFLDTMLSVSDRFAWPRLFSALTTYRQTGNLIRLLAGYTLAFGIFVLGNLGSRIIGINYFKSWKRFGPVEYFLLAIFAFGVIIPTVFVQSGTPWNTIQFFYYSLYAANIFAALAVSDLLRRIRDRSWRPLLLVLLVMMTLPTTVDSLKHYLPSRPPAKVSLEELEALAFLAGRDPGVVLEYPVSPDPYAPAPRPLYLYESTAYVTALSGRISYLADTVNLNITGYDWPQRQALVAEFVSTASASAAREFLSRNHIRYIYLADVSDYRPKLSASQLGGEIIFENSQSAVWAVNSRSFGP